MRVALAQIDTVVGDIQGNVAKVLQAIGRADEQGVGLLLFPELTLTGYPPEDLVSREHFVEDNLDALEQVSAAAGNAAIVGFVDRGPGGELFNASALVGNHRVLRIYHKRLLPNYGVFDEKRYFSAGDDPGLFELGSTMFDMTVCEDVWVPELIVADAGDGARVVLNISASPFHAGKGREREEMLQQRAREAGVWLAYCNLVGGQDELVFDGRSVIISPSGEVVSRAKAFEEDFLITDFAAEGRLGAPERVEDVLGGTEEIYRALMVGLRDYVDKNGFSDVVVGLSGGIDSALTATLAADALGPGRVHGVLMPSRFSSPGSLTDARALASNLGIDTVELGIEDAFEAFNETLAPVFEGQAFDVTEENLQARVRGTLLMALSNKFKWLVLATGNKSELSVGYSTLYGDMVGGFAPIKDVFKTRVFELARWRNEKIGLVIPEETMVKAPSAELRDGQLDADSLPPYEVLDPILERYVECDMSREAIGAAGFAMTDVDRVADLVDAAEYKRRQGPLGIKITPKAFGKDRRVPVTNRYKG
jgi:NAD+ synthase (glutamine-hydrolysing)